MLQNIILCPSRYNSGVFQYKNLNINAEFLKHCDCNPYVYLYQN